MNMGSDWFFKKPGYKEFFFPKDCLADRANPAAISFQAVNAAGNMH
jgi:hypothetical protein